MDSEYFGQLEGRMVALLSLFKDRLMPACFDNAMSYVVHAGEYGLAFEELCEWLVDDEVWTNGRAPRLSTDQYREVESLGRMMEIDESCWTKLVRVD